MLYFACQIQISIKTILNKGIKLNQYLNLSYITKQCEHCDDDFNASLKEHKRGNARFCSLSCSSRRSRTVKGNNCICARCGTEFYRSPSKKLNAKSSGLQFCSRICKDTAQRIGGIKEIQPDHYGIIGTRYRTLAFRELNKECFDCGYDKHESVLEVHHLDCDRTNNKLDNLVILCPTCHVERHAGLRPNINASGQVIVFKEKMVEPVGLEPTAS